MITALPPLSLYVHLPWCVRKCPYCDFNSHEAKSALPEALYVEALMDQLDRHLPITGDRPLISIFFGGGTPSLFSPTSIEAVLTGVAKRFQFVPGIEITLEANPGTIDLVRFKGFRQAGVNRLSLGIQSLNDHALKELGRIHDSNTAIRAIDAAKKAGFTNFNLDLMYGLPNQTIDEALFDLNTVIPFQPTHLSWYQLTIEPNTVFYKTRPTLPPDDTLWNMQLEGQMLLKKHGYESYEVSAYANAQRECAHNRNYWEFGDYLGIGAGAHSKITQLETGTVIRFAQVKQPNDYLLATKRVDVNKVILNADDLSFEFMLNALRLTQGVSMDLFSKRTGLALDTIVSMVEKAKMKGLLEEDVHRLCPSLLGKRFLNDLVGMFLK